MMSGNVKKWIIIGLVVGIGLSSPIIESLFGKIGLFVAIVIFWIAVGIVMTLDWMSKERERDARIEGEIEARVERDREQK